MKKIFIRIILSVVIGFNFLIPTFVYAGDPDENQPEQQKIILDVYYNGEIKKVWIKNEASIYVLDGLLGKTLDYIFKGNFVDKGKPAQDVFPESNVLLIALDTINLSRQKIQYFQDFSSNNLKISEKTRASLLILTDESDFGKHLRFTKDLHFLKEMNSSKKSALKMCRTLRNYTSLVSPTSNSKPPAIIDSEEKLLEPSATPLPPLW